MAYKRTTIHLAILKPHSRSIEKHDFELLPFPAYESKHPALAIHRQFDRSVDEASIVPIPNSTWQISHKITGQHVFTFGRLADAMRFTADFYASTFDPFDKKTGALLPRDQQPENLSEHMMSLLVKHYGSR